MWFMVGGLVGGGVGVTGKGIFCEVNCCLFYLKVIFSPREGREEDDLVGFSFLSRRFNC